MCEQFHHDEPGYERWIAEHPEGWVFNNFGGGNQTYNKLHHLPCWNINKPSQRGRWTVYEKLCCPDRECIGRTIAQRRGPEDTWENCPCVARNA